MKSIQVIIQPNGREAREVNQRVKPSAEDFVWNGQKPYRDYDSMYRDALMVFNKSESVLRTFTIQVWETQGKDGTFSTYSPYRPGATHTAEIIDEEKLIVRIVS